MLAHYVNRENRGAKLGLVFVVSLALTWFALNFLSPLLTAHAQSLVPIPARLGYAAIKTTAEYLGLGACSTLNPISYVSVTCLALYTNQVIGFLAGFLIMLVMMILEYALELNSTIFQLPAVQIGWTLVRDVANMGFVLGIIVISFATILRSQTYGVKQLLVKLIIAAGAVNLSLSIAGVFLDIAGIPTQYFIDKISQQAVGPFAFSDTLASAFNIHNIR